MIFEKYEHCNITFNVGTYLNTINISYWDRDEVKNIEGADANYENYLRIKGQLIREGWQVVEQDEQPPFEMDNRFNFGMPQEAGNGSAILKLKRVKK